MKLNVFGRINRMSQKRAGMGGMGKRLITFGLGDEVLKEEI